MGEEKLDNAVYFIRGLYDFADMAKAKKKTADAKWANDLANKLRASFDETWWNEESIAVRRLAQGRRSRSSRSTGSASRRWRSS